MQLSAVCRSVKRSSCEFAFRRELLCSFFCQTLCPVFLLHQSHKRAKAQYTSRPHGLLSCFITDSVPGVFKVFKLQAGPSVTLFLPFMFRWKRKKKPGSILVRILHRLNIRLFFGIKIIFSHKGSLLNHSFIPYLTVC